MICSIYDYGSAGYKVNVFKGNPFSVFTSCKKNSNDDNIKLQNNVSRAKSRIKELALCNEWTYFVTMTVAPTAFGVDRHDLSACVKKLGYFIQNQNKKYQSAIRYLIIPEQHKDGAYHFHGLMSGFCPNQLATNEHGYLDWLDYRNRFGFCSLSPIKNKIKVAHYITKYVTKDINSTAVDKNKHLFYASRNLQSASKVDIINVEDKVVSALNLFETDYCFVGYISKEQMFQLYANTHTGLVPEKVVDILRKGK